MLVETRILWVFVSWDSSWVSPPLCFRFHGLHLPPSVSSQEYLPPSASLMSLPSAFPPRLGSEEDSSPSTQCLSSLVVAEMTAMSCTHCTCLSQHGGETQGQGSPLESLLGPRSSEHVCLPHFLSSLVCQLITPE